jgi:hypothetical protein
MALFLIFSSCGTHQYKRSIRNPERGLFGRSLNTRTVKYREAPSIVRAKKKQEANQQKLKKEYEDYIVQNRKRALEIQTPEVRERMSDNRKNSELNYKEKKKRLDKASRKNRRKQK